MNDVFKAEPQDRTLLDKAAPNNPVVLSDETNHSTWANSLALKIAGITKERPNPLNDVIEHRADGQPNGLLREAAAGLYVPRFHAHLQMTTLPHCNSRSRRCWRPASRRYKMPLPLVRHSRHSRCWQIEAS